MRTFAIFLLFVAFFEETKQQNGFVSEVTQNYAERVNSRLEQQVFLFHQQELFYKAYATYYDRADVDLLGFKKYFVSMADRTLANARNLTTYINDRGGRMRFPVVQLQDACDDVSRELQKFEITKTSSDGWMTKPARVKPHICLFQTKSLDQSVARKKKKYGKKGAFKKYFSWLSTESATSDSDSSTVKENRQDWQAGLYGMEDALAMEKYFNNGLLDLVAAANRFRDPQTKLKMEELLVQHVDTIKKLADLVTRLQNHDSENYPVEEYLINLELL